MEEQEEGKEEQLQRSPQDFRKALWWGVRGVGPPEKIFKLTVVLPIFFNSFTYKVGGNTPNEAGFIVPNFHLVRTDYL